MHYTIMGDIYAREVLGVSRPKVGLLSVGTEANKGDELTQEAFNLAEVVWISSATSRGTTSFTMGWTWWCAADSSATWC